MMAARCAPWSWKSPRSPRGLPSTTSRSAAAPGRDRPQAPLLPQHARGHGGGGLDHLDRLHDLAADQELAALLVLERAEQIAAVGHGHPGPLADLQRAVAVLEHEVVLGEHLRRHPELRGALLHHVVGDEVGDQERALVRHEPRRGLVDEVAVLDRAHPGVHRARDGVRRVGVRAHVAAEGLRLLDGGPRLGRGVLEAVERVEGRGHAARHHDLDLVGALSHLLARGPADLVGPVGQLEREGHGVAAAARRVAVGAPARVAVAARRADGAAGDEEPRPGQEALLHRRLDPPVRAAGVADGREAAVDHAAHEHGGARGHQREGHVLEVPDVHLAQVHVHVAVDEPGHQRAPTAVDHRRPRHGERPARDLADGVVLDEDLVAAEEPVVGRGRGAARS